MKAEKKQSNVLCNIDFTKVDITELDGNSFTADVSKEFASYIYSTTPNLGMLIVAQEMYKNGIVSVTEDIKGEIIWTLKEKSCPFLAKAKQRMIEIVESSINH